MAKTVLIVEDSPTIMEIECSILQLAGFETLCAVDGIEGIQKAHGEKPDLILLDIKLPDMDGYQVCRLLKSEPDTKSIPVIMATASEIEKKDEFWGLEVGADAYLIKPFEPEELISEVKKLLKIEDVKKAAD
jgi:twitching motility two-component system response regulator PilH